MKYVHTPPQAVFCQVAPLAGAWIEISKPSAGYLFVSVAPLAGAWIEILVMWI